jgi:D-glycero-alpha-D-manno-heptose-7-phosphate kinase
VSAPRLVVARAPLRVSFVGGGSDLPPPAGASGVVGACISSTIDRYVYCLTKPRDDGLFYLSWKEKEVVSKPADFHHEIVRRAFADLEADGARFPGGVELAFVADVPGTGSGLGSSAATAAACLLALDHLAEKYDGIHGRRALAERSIAVQPGHRHGKQDEYATVFGGLNAMRFTAEVDTFERMKDAKLPKKDREVLWQEQRLSVDLSPIGEEDPGAPAWLQERFALFRPPAGASRSACDVLATYKPEYDTAFRVGCLLASEKFVEALRARSFQGIDDSVLMHSVMKEKAFGGYSSDRLQAAIKALADVGVGAVKLCGAGGTGHLLVGFEPERRAAVVEAAEKAWGKELKFRFSTQGAAAVYREAE